MSRPEYSNPHFRTKKEWMDIYRKRTLEVNKQTLENYRISDKQKETQEVLVDIGTILAFAGSAIAMFFLFSLGPAIIMTGVAALLATLFNVLLNGDRLDRSYHKGMLKDVIKEQYEELAKGKSKESDIEQGHSQSEDYSQETSKEKDDYENYYDYDSPSTSASSNSVRNNDYEKSAGSSR